MSVQDRPLEIQSTREKSKSQTDLGEVVVGGQDVDNSQFLHDDHARQVRE